MQARGPLMVGHRLTERMLRRIEEELGRIEVAGKVDLMVVGSAVDFIRMCADRTHHGKEEDILFSDLEEKGLSPSDRQVMEELIEEHVSGRNTTKALVDASSRYRDGDAAALADITSALKTLVAFYPTHIEKEDRVFFPAARAYFTDEEDQAMLARFWEFDGKTIHEKYKAVVESLGG